jgi:hypothetical protein
MKLSQEIKSIFSVKNETVTLGSILNRVNQKSFGVLLVILALPSALPLPAPGFAIPFGIGLIFLALDIIKNKPFPTLPKKLVEKEIKTKEDSKLISSMTRFMAFFEKFLKPRFSAIYNSSIFKRSVGLIILICAVSMCIPIPLTNTIPAFGVFLIGLGMLEEDLLFTSLGALVSLAGVALTVTLITLISIFGLEAIELTENFIKDTLGL